jgi:glycosyltransferase involved in cell wall biosynthesis
MSKKKILICGKLPDFTSNTSQVDGPKRVVLNLFTNLLDDNKSDFIYIAPYRANRSVIVTLFVIAFTSISLANVHNIGYVQYFCALLARIRKNKLIYTCHGLIKMEKINGYDYPLFFEYFEYYILSRAQIIIAVSEMHKNNIIKYYPFTSKKIIIIPNGIDDKFIAEESIVAETDNNIPKVLFLGGAIKTKGLNFLIKSLNRLDIKIDLYLGGAPKDEYLESDTLCYNNKINTKYIGRLNDSFLVDYIRKADVLVFPSYYDSFGLMPLEAMGLGTVVIVSNRVGMSYLIRSGVNGFVVKYDDEVELSNLLRNIFEKKINLVEIKKNAIKTAYTMRWKEIAKLYRDTFKELLIK